MTTTSTSLLGTSTSNTSTSSLIQSSTGLGSGINISSIVSQLVTAEGQATYNRINTQENTVNTRLSGIGSLKSALSTFQTAVKSLQTSSTFQTNAATSSNASVLTVTPGSGSVAATHSIVVKQLAAAQSSVTDAEFANGASVVGSGSLTFTMGSGATFDVSIDSTNNTLVGIRDAINNASGNTYVSASIINVDSSTSGGGTISKLVLTSKNTGTANSFTVSGTDSDGSTSDSAGLSQLFSNAYTKTAYQTAAADAQITVDGLAATRSSNNISDVLPGVTLNLQSVSAKDTTTQAYTPVTLGVTLDTKAITTAVNNFVTAYNNLHTVTQGLGTYGGVGGTNGALFGDSTLEFVNNQIRTQSTYPVTSATGGYNSLAMIGVSVDQYGVMSLDSTQLNKALTADVQSVSNVFTSSNGVATRLGSTLTNLLQTGGTFDSQIKSLNGQMTALETQRTKEQSYLDSYQASLQKEYTAMDTLVGKYNSTSSFLTSWIAKGG